MSIAYQVKGHRADKEVSTSPCFVIYSHFFRTRLHRFLPSVKSSVLGEVSASA